VNDGDGGFTFGAFDVNVAAPVVVATVPEPWSAVVWGGVLTCGVVVRAGVRYWRRD
jgi:hypothetical protein